MELTASGEMPTLLAMAHQPNNEQKLVALVALNIAALDEYLHLNNRLSEREIDLVSETIVGVYGGALSFADINLVLTNAKNGAYGRFYERLSGSDILKWFADYFEQRTTEASYLSMSEHERSMFRVRAKGIEANRSPEFLEFRARLLLEKAEQQNKAQNAAK